MHSFEFSVRGICGNVFHLAFYSIRVFVIFFRFQIAGDVNGVDIQHQLTLGGASSGPW